MDRADLTRVNALYEEARLIVSALGNFSNGGRIIAMTVSPAAQIDVPPAVPGITGMAGPPIFGMSITVPTSSIEYPPQMVTSIRTALEQRRAAILAELTQLGMTGVE
jgi:hypothetical protein